MGQLQRRVAATLRWFYAGEGILVTLFVAMVILVWGVLSISIPREDTYEYRLGTCLRATCPVGYFISFDPQERGTQYECLCLPGVAPVWTVNP